MRPTLVRCPLPLLGPYLWPGRDFSNVMSPDPTNVLAAAAQRFVVELPPDVRLTW